MAMSTLSGSVNNASSVYREAPRNEPARLYYRRNDDEEWQQVDGSASFGWTSGNSFGWGGPFDPRGDIERAQEEISRCRNNIGYFANRCRSCIYATYSADWQGQWEVSGSDNNEALAKSRKLLMSFLDGKQLAEFEKHTRITVKAAKNVYRIYPQEQFNVQQRQSDGKWLKLCAIPNKSLPIYDTMLAQMLVLQTNEDAFLKVANTERGWMTIFFEWENPVYSYGR